jgi:hypothetical protein
VYTAFQRAITARPFHSREIGRPLR